MIRRLLLSSLIISAFTLPAFADPYPKADDTVIYDMSAEDWVTTKTAHVTLNVEAAVSAATAGTMRADMIKAVDDTAKAEWRLTGFSRSQDQTGLERWSAQYDARLPEPSLSGLADAAKKASKAGMQITVGNVDFSPTLDETEAVQGALRARLLKEASDQLATLNTALPGRGYRIAHVAFDNPQIPLPGMQPRVMRKPMMMSAMASNAAMPGAPADGDERSEKIIQTAHVTFAALAPLAPATH